MKKNYFLLAASTMMFAACAQTDMVNEVVTEEAPQAIGFETFSNKITRQVSNATALQSYHDAFGVWAYKTTKDDGAVMPNYKVAYNNGDWNYKNQDYQSIKYWDKEAKYSFYAYAPYRKEGVSINGGVISIAEGKYAATENLQEDEWGTTINDDKFETDTDWMIATTVEDYDNYKEKVAEVFNHIMSKLVVKLRSTVSNTVINSVSINNVHGTGSFDGSKWSTGNNAAVNIDGETGTINKAYVKNGTAVDNADTEFYSMEYLLIPSTAKPTFTINYTISGDTYEVTKDITGIDEFEINTNYILTVTIDLVAIEFTASAAEWADGTPTGSTTIE